MKSMTGFARTEISGETFSLSGHLSAVNSKNFNLKMRLPEGYMACELPLRKRIMKHVSRGSCTLQIELQWQDQSPVSIDEQRLQGFLNEFEAKVGAKPSSLSIQDIAAIPDIFQGSHDVFDETVAASIESLVDTLIAEFNTMRAREGDDMKAILARMNQEVQDAMPFIRERAGCVVEENMQRMRDRVNQLLADTSVELKPEDTLREVGLLADRIDINEEIERLETHTKAFASHLDDDRIGKKLDFMLQEMNREVNTMGAKCSQIDISQKVIHLKSLIESLREQVQNIE